MILDENQRARSLWRAIQDHNAQNVHQTRMVPEVECRHEMFVETPWEHKRTLAVPLSQLKVVHGDEATGQAVEDGHYWVEMGYVL